MVDFDVYYKQNAYIPELLNVRVVSKSPDFFVGALDYLKNYRNLNVHLRGGADAPALQFLIVGEKKLAEIVRDLEDIKCEVIENIKQVGTIEERVDKALEKEEGKKPEDCRCDCEKHEDQRNCKNEEKHACRENDLGNGKTTIQITINGSAEDKQKFIDRLLVAVKTIAEDIVSVE